MAEMSGSPPGVDLTRPSIARVYDYFLGGSLHTEADRRVALQVQEAMPDLPAVIRENRAFVHRAVEYMAGQGIRQFLDLGSGLATAGAVHEVAGGVGAEARVVYVDTDSLVTAYNQMLLPATTTAAVQADLRDVDAVLAAPEAKQLLDPDEPTGLLMTAVLHFIPPAARPARIIARYRDALAPGSCLAITHAESNHLKGTMQAARRYSAGVAPIHLRTRTEVAAMLDGWRLVEPGVVPLSEWRPRPGRRAAAIRLQGLAAVGRKAEER